jgi:N-formylglutamate deformylase
LSDLSWLTIVEGDAPLLVSIPHTGTDLGIIEPRLVLPWLARKDTDWWIERLYDFTASLGATVIRTAISRTVIDVNRDPSGASLYPGQATTGLCPLTTFDGEPLYRPGEEPGAEEIAERRHAHFDPYHTALRGQIERLCQSHRRIVLYDCHSIRSVIPRLFEGRLPVFNLGTNSGASADTSLVDAVTEPLAASGRSMVINGRFKGGWITRAYGQPTAGVYALQMELACRGYMPEPDGPVDASNWPVPYDADYAADLRGTLTELLEATVRWTRL